MRAAGAGLGRDEPALVAPIFGHDRAVLGKGRCEDDGIHLGPEVGPLDDGDYIVAAITQLPRDACAPHLVEEQPQARSSARLRSHSASARSASSSRRRIQSSISSRYWR